MNLGSRKTLFIAAGLLVVAIAALLVIVVLGGKKKAADDPAASAPPAAQTAATVPGNAGAPGAPGAPAPGQPAGTPPGGEPAAALPIPGAPADPAVSAMANAASAKERPGQTWASIRVGSGDFTTTSRRDPLVFLQPPPVPILPEQMLQLPTVSLQLGGLRPQELERVDQTGMIANRRVCGVKFNGGAWAILEQGTGTFVVKPGDTIEGTKIKSISRDAIYITDPQGQGWIVPLRAAGPGGAATPVVTRRVSGTPNSPSGF